MGEKKRSGHIKLEKRYGSTTSLIATQSHESYSWLSGDIAQALETTDLKNKQLV